ncbi:MAG TPA: hypothetical protein VMU38_05120 [Candidatus Binatia bacterium]|nr:hypothetical protein [Candidatus Binatia bacterium]
MFRLRLKPALVALAAVLAVGSAGCAGSRSMLPGIGPEAAQGIVMERAGSFTRLRNHSQPPVGMEMAWLMTDGSVLAQSYAGNTWYKYVPDDTGSYANGTWTQVATLPSGYDPDAFASDVLADGRLVISGGEYNSPGNYDLQLVNLGAVYDPAKNTWTKLGHPNHWKWIGDSPSTVLPNGQLMMGDKLHPWDAVLIPKSLKWKTVSDKGKSDWNAEEGWTLLADGTILTEDVKNAPNSEIYDPATGKWKTAGSTIVDLHSPSPFKQCLTYGPKTKDCYLPPGEIGPAILRPDGTVFATGSGSGPSGYGTGHTAVYHSTGSQAGTWTVGPDFPNGDNAGDSFAVLEPSGNVLVFGVSGELYEFNGTTFVSVGGAAGPPILLPTGQVMMLGYSSVVLYTPTGSPKSGWAPTITSSPSTISSGQTYQISGTQFNGLSQAMSFGDEYQNATNYPLVRIVNNASGHVFYAKTHDHSTMGVATGSEKVSTNFDVPSGIETGASKLYVVANGIASKAANVTVSSGLRRRHRNR